jgi:ankyrin repeat protein
MLYAKSVDKLFNNKTALMYAAAAGHLEIINLLKDKESKM